MQPARPEPLLSDEDYGAIEAAVMETARGRWFLAEFARRNRNADTDAVLSAIRRLERLVQSAGTFDARDEVTRGMADIAQAIAAAQIVPATPRGLSAPFEVQAETVVEHPAHDEAAPAEAIPAETHQQAHDEVIVEPLATHEAESSMVEPEPSPIEPESQPVYQESVVAEATVELAPVPAGEAEETVSFEAEAPETAEAESPPAPVREEPAPAQVPPERDVFVELESFLAEAIPAPQAEQVMAAGVPSDPPPRETKAETSTEPFPIIELDEAAAEALLTQDPPRHELILPTNHLVTQRWHKDFGHEVGEPVEVKPATDEPLRTSLVTFIDEEPVDESESVFSAPLRLEPEEAVEREPAPVAEFAEATTVSSHPPIAPPMTIGEIEAMPFAKKAVLFS